MIIGRLLGYFFLSLMMVVVGAEGLRIIEGKNEEWIAISVILDFFDSNSVWQKMFDPIGNLPAIFTFIAIAIMMFYVSRDRIH